MRKSLFLVTAPFNVTCFQEAIYDFKINSAYILCIVYDENSENHKKLLKKIDTLDINKKEIKFIYYKEVAKKSLYERIAFYANIIPLLKNKNFDLVFFSEFRVVWQEDIINTLRHPSTYMLDDGTSTIGFLEYHWPIGKVFSIPSYSTSERKKEASRIKEQLGINLIPFTTIYIYTIFKPLFINLKNIEHNSLKHISRSFKTINKDQEIIVGTKLVTANLIELKDYTIFIKNIIKEIESKKEILYIPHRGQDKTNTQKLLDACPELKLLEPSISIEDYIKNHENPPSKIHGFISTAFFIINTAYPQIKINCYSLPNSYLESIKEKKFWGSDQYGFYEGTIAMYKHLPKEINLIKKVDL